MAVAVSLAAAQLRHRPLRWALLVAGVALAAAIPIVAAGAGNTVAAQTVRTTVKQMSPGDRSITVFGTGTIYSPSEAASFDKLIRQQLGRLSSAPVKHELVFHQLSLDTATFFLGGVDNLPGSVRLLDGRLPQSCTPKRCEVVAIGGDEKTLAHGAASLGLVVVGRAQRTDETVLGGELDPGTTPLLLGDNADAVGNLASLSLFARTYGWVTSLDVNRVIALGVPAYVRRSTDVANTVVARVDGAGVTNPDSTLTAQYHRASLSARRFGLLGGTAAVLLLGFAVIAAVGLRREHAVLVSVLRRRGSRISGVVRVATLEAGAACLTGAVLGGVIGAVVAAGLAQNADVPSWRTIGHAIGSAWLATLLLLLGAVVVTVAVLLWPDRDRRTVWHTVELLGVGCLGAVLLAASRGSTSAASLASGSDPLVVALPVLAAVIGGLVAARLWAPLARAAERLVPRRSVAGRIGLLGAIRRPLRPVATTAFLTAAVASVVFAGAYRSTLLDGAVDQAAYQVPLDATITGGRDVTTPLAVTSPAQLANDGAQAYGVVRTSAVIRPLDGSVKPVALLGVDRSALPEVRRWSRVTGTSASPGRLGDKLKPLTAPPVAPTVAGTARTLTLDVSGKSPAVDFVLWLASADGQDGSVPLSGTGSRLSGPVPHLGDGPLRVIGLSVSENIDFATRHQHAVGEGNGDHPITAGTVTLGAVRADGAPLTWNWAGWGTANGSATPVGTGLRYAYRIEGAQSVLIPGYTAPPELPMAVDPATARIADHGKLTVTLDEVTIIGRVVSVLPRFPTTSGSFLLTDRTALAALLDRQQPGTGSTRELWVSGAHLAPTLAKAPFDQLTVTMRAPIQHQLTTDPVASGSRLLLALIAGLALLVAAVSVVLLVLGERRDDAGELHAWEADGLRPATLRRVLFLRALSVVAVAVPFGLATGLILARLGATLVAVDASGVAPVPPLQASIGALWTAVLLLIGVGLAVGLAWTVAARMLRERLPARPELDLR
ncbi:MAG TPA: FtsX-like permease family protein [Jatrophihabitantaceae bacterium]